MYNGNIQKVEEVDKSPDSGIFKFKNLFGTTKKKVIPRTLED